ncbi:MAG: 4-hydroxythreonine-4-phosphate dehydrogenase PdxA [Acidobacteriota bacterium]
MKIKIGITTGDPAGIGPEVSLKAAYDLEVQSLCTPILIGDGDFLRKTAREIGHPETYSVEGTSEKNVEKVNGFLIYNVAGSARGVPTGKASAEGGKAASEYIRIGAQLALERKIGALVTAPICKESLQLAGVRHSGHTEFLASLSGVKEVGMLFYSHPLKIFLLTTHLSLKDAIGHVRKEEIVKKAKLLTEEYLRLFNEKPKIGICSLNPHAGEGGLFGEEENKEIIPAIEELRLLNIDVSGPYASDSIYARAMKGEFDLVFALYHDQGLIPIKSLKLRAVNVTLGLPFVRTSPDHGTAFDIVGKDVADPCSMIEAIKLAAMLLHSRSI